MKKTPIVRKPESISTRIKIYRSLKEAIDAPELERLTETSHQKLADRIALLNNMRQELKKDLLYLLENHVQNIMSDYASSEDCDALPLAKRIIEVL